MRVSLKRFIIFVVCLGAGSAFAQSALKLSSPQNRIVLQRNQENKATIYISGSYTDFIDRVEVQLRPLNGGQITSWTTIQQNPTGGYFAGSFEWTAGWYELEVRGWSQDRLVGSDIVPRVGIGEVFLVAGQSNAQGFFNYGAPSATDDRVNCVNYYNNSGPNGGGSATDLPSPVFSQLSADSYISPRGVSAWAWGRLGDLLAQKLGVPVLFYNVAWSGTAVRNWRESLLGTAISIYNGEPYQPTGMPSANIRLAFRHYISTTGIRAILWLQGEGDNFAGTSRASYASDLDFVIRRLREETSRDVAWVVTNTSYDNARGVNQAVVQAQSDVINNTPNTFRGPNTDRIQIPRPDGVHLQGAGIVDLANAWNEALSLDFFDRTRGIAAIPPPTLSVSCASDYTLTLRVNGPFTEVEWNTGQRDPQIQVGAGQYTAKVRDASGNVFTLPTFSVPVLREPRRPRILTEGSPLLCQGGSLALTATDVEGSTVWNTGQTTSQITVTSAQEYFVTNRNVFGCERRSESVVVSASPTPPPAAPTVSAAGATTFCEGGEVVLQANSIARVVWSNGQQGASISIRNSGTYRAKAVDQFGCTSLTESAPIEVRVNPLPLPPTISLSANPAICQGERLTLTSSYASGNQWSTNAAERAIIVNQAGSYTVQYRDAFGCTATSDAVQITVKPLPEAPTVASLRPTTFCQGDFTQLQANSPHAMLRWNSGATTRMIEIRNGGEYSVRAIDAGGCVSPPSLAVRVVVNPVPERPTVLVSGSTRFCANEQGTTLSATTASGYVWSNGRTMQSIAPTVSGNYTVRVRNQFGCISVASQPVSITVLPIPQSPTITLDGPATFCEGNSTLLIANGIGGVSFEWNTGSVGSTLLVSTKGSYSVRMRGTNGCLSGDSEVAGIEVKETPPKPIITQSGLYMLEDGNPPRDEFRYEWMRSGQVLPPSSRRIKASVAGSYGLRTYIVHGPDLTCISEPADLLSFVLNESDNQIIAYPIPVGPERLLYIESPSMLENLTVQLLDLNAKEIASYFIPLLDEQYTLRIPMLPRGVYILKMRAAAFNATQKIVIAQ